MYLLCGRSKQSPRPRPTALKVLQHLDLIDNCDLIVLIEVGHLHGACDVTARFAVFSDVLSLFAGHEIAVHAPGIGLGKDFHGQEFERAAVDPGFGGHEALEGVVGLAAVGRAGVENDLAVHIAGFRVPERGVAQVADAL